MIDRSEQYVYEPRHPLLERLRSIVGSDLTVRHFAWLTLLASAALSVVGLYAIDLATNSVADAPINLSGTVLRQVIFLAVGVLAGAGVAFPHYAWIRGVAWPLMWVVLALLIFLLIPFVPHWLVTPRNGARGWINLGPVDFQPAEVAKIAFILVLADYLRFRRNHRTVTGLIPPAVIAFVPMALITLQPDLGTAILFVPTLFAMVVAAGARLKHVCIVVVAAALAGPAVFPVLKPHQKQRIIGLINIVQGSKEGADGINYQSITAMTLAGAGGREGTPEDKSRALIRFNRLPERHNDMIFAVIVNRFGFRGGLAVLGLYGLWFLGALLTAAFCKDPFGRLVVIGCCAIMAAQMCINVGMNIGLLPIIGLTLPFISYGGSSMLTVWIMTGLIFNIATRRPQRLARPSFEFGNDDDYR